MSWDVLVEAAESIRDMATKADRSLVELPLAGVGWASVDAERSQREFDELFRSESMSAAAGTWSEQPRDAVLGARVWLPRAPGVKVRPWLVLLEPDTEGRLAASLARLDEGIAVIYLGTGRYRRGRLGSRSPALGPHVVVLDDTDGDERT